MVTIKPMATHWSVEPLGDFNQLLNFRIHFAIALITTIRSVAETGLWHDSLLEQSLPAMSHLTVVFRLGHS
jgi:hypothetical protein